MKLTKITIFSLRENDFLLQYLVKHRKIQSGVQYTEN